MNPSPLAAPGQEILGWGLMSSRALSMDRDSPLLVGLHRTSLDNTSTSCTEITQCNLLARPDAPGGGWAQGELWQKRQPCRKGADVRLRRDACWSSAGSKGNLERSIMHESTGATKGTRAAYGSEGHAWATPAWGPSALWQHPEPYDAHAHCQCQASRSLWAAFPAFHSNCNSRAPSPAQQAQGQRSCVRSSWKI